MAFKKFIYTVCIILNTLFAMYVYQNAGRLFLGDTFGTLFKSVPK